MTTKKTKKSLTNQTKAISILFIALAVVLIIAIIFGSKIIKDNNDENNQNTDPSIVDDLPKRDN